MALYFSSDVTALTAVAFLCSLLISVRVLLSAILSQLFSPQAYSKFVAAMIFFFQCWKHDNYLATNYRWRIHDNLQVHQARDYWCELVLSTEPLMFSEMLLLQFGGQFNASCFDVQSGGGVYFNLNCTEIWLGKRKDEILAEESSRRGKLN